MKSDRRRHKVQEAKNSGKIWRIVAITGVIVALVAVIAVSSFGSKPSNADKVWNKAATVGEEDARNYYVMYTDLMCPYCDVFSRAVMEHWDEFQQYLAEHDILFELRLTDYLYEGHDSRYSRDAAEAGYCAMRENKFWEYYHGAIGSLWEDYHSKGIGDSKSSPQIKDLPDDYWQKIGHEAGLGKEFDDCVTEHATLDELDANTMKALQLAEGMPYFKFNKFAVAGFNDGWGWDYVLRYLDAGLEK